MVVNMSDLHKKKSQWFLELNPGDKSMLYQPKVMPKYELDFLEKTLARHLIEKAFYTKISVNMSGEIVDYHLVAFETESGFIVDDLLADLASNQEVLAGFKFLDLSTNNMLAKDIMRSKLFYKK